LKTDMMLICGWGCADHFRNCNTSLIIKWHHINYNAWADVNGRQTACDVPVAALCILSVWHFYIVEVKASIRRAGL